MNNTTHNTKTEDAELKRRATNKSKILAALIQAGKLGVTNAELSQIHLRYGVSINVLTKEGHVITNTLIKGGLRRYVLASIEPRVDSQPPLAKNASSIEASV